MARRGFVLAYLGADCPKVAENNLLDQAEAVAESLKGCAPTPTEILLADAAGSLWLGWHIAEMGFPERAGAIHRRYLLTLRTLDAVRRVGAMIQVNVASRQVVANIANAPANRATNEPAQCR